MARAVATLSARRISVVASNHRLGLLGYLYLGELGGEDYATSGLGNVPEVVTHVKEVKKNNTGIVSMKLVGEGPFGREDRQAAMKFAFRNAGVDSVTVGYKNTAEIDEAIENLNAAFA